MNSLVLFDKDDLRELIRESIKEIVTDSKKEGESPISLSPLLTRDEAAKMLDVTLVTLGQWVKDGRIPAPKKIGKRVYFLRKTFIEFLEDSS